MTIIDEFKSKTKENPNGYIIIDKYNYRVFNRYRVKLFNYFYEQLEKQWDSIIEEYFKNFTDVIDAAAGA